MRRLLATVVWAVLCVVPSTLSAQDYDAGEIHGTYSFLNFDTNGVTSRQNANGWEAGASSALSKWFGVEFSLSGYYKRYAIPIAEIEFRDYAFGAGPRANFKRLFAHALLGGDVATTRALGANHTQNGWAGAFGGGVQQKISSHWALRASADYVFTRHKLTDGGPAYQQNNFRASFGIAYVFRGHVQEEATPSPAPLSIPKFGISVVSTNGSKGAEIVRITPDGVGDRGGLRVGYVITSVNDKPVRTLTDLMDALSAASGKVQIGYNFKAPSGWAAGVASLELGAQQ